MPSHPVPPFDLLLVRAGGYQGYLPGDHPARELAGYLWKFEPVSPSTAKELKGLTSRRAQLHATCVARNCQHLQTFISSSLGSFFVSTSDPSSGSPLLFHGRAIATLTEVAP
jgi:hypothetical protein